MSRNYGAKVITMCMGLSLCLQAPVTALAASPEFARTTEAWAKLRDNVLEYDELEDLIYEYNPTVQNTIPVSICFRQRSMTGKLVMPRMMCLRSLRS